MTPPRPSRAAIESALSVLRLERAVVSLGARRRLRTAEEHPDCAAASTWRRWAERDDAEALQLAEVIAWMEGQDG